MNILFIIAIVLAACAVIFWLLAWRKDSPSSAMVGLGCALSALLLWAGGATINQDRFNEESVRICDSKGGTVSKDNHCMVNGTPAEFAPGVWQRNP